MKTVFNTLLHLYDEHQWGDFVVEKNIIGQTLDFPILAMYSFETCGGESRVARENYMFTQFL